ncbi:MAG: hypothetical protein WHS64_00265 [Fervidobacterium sp.]|uniref:Uncharacterized protein n=1 Tax=Fervidobacterium gondwanense DSM 13020 TaxID=1121883 RepID=A0A1M7S543_FERGO|nr:hypothetical protein [Fervidobacterium gondwanense]UXF00816.1 hypothetical protein IB67_04400 [Fervidobacterium riparium]SHN53524.1 hypothetical protein SAMN02745226_00494 [Fervidobacterium gondwanense DSM 13020]
MIGYLSVKSIDGKYLGGILIVNDYGIPVEFKYSEPIVPTRLQQIIYGNSLEYYLNTEIISKGLIQKLENRPELLLVEDPMLLFDKNIVMVTLLPQMVNEKTEGNEAVVNVNNKSIRITFPENIKVENTLVQKVVELSQKFDIFEPFDRIEKALEYVCESQER